MVLLRNEKLLLVELKDLITPAEVRLWQPPDIDDPDPCSRGNYTQIPMPLDSNGFPIEMYCTAHSQLPNGKIVFIGGGLSALVPHNRTVIFDPGAPPSAPWTQMDDMPPVTVGQDEVDGDRWYATTTTLGDGTVLVLAGDRWNANPHTADNPLLFDWTKGENLQYTPLTDGAEHLPVYPFVYQLSNRKVFYAGFDKHVDSSYPTPYPKTQLFNLDNQAWSNKGDQPTTGPAVMYRPDFIMKAGASNPESDGVWTIDPTVSGSTWTSVAPMITARGHFHSTVLPDGKILVAGGKNQSGDVLEVEFYDADANTWSPMDPLDEPRSHHGTLALLPDGRVVVAGETSAPALETVQIFSPPYLFQGPRPMITAFPPVLDCGTFTVGTSQTVDEVSLVRLASVTYGNNFDQRFIPLPIVSSSSGRGGYSVTVEAPKNQ